ncbi:cupredoxin domain-containing protein [Hoyosella subflava]|uniref:Amicyanin n=1 Tax=Hoyosella subflava (strain DSM 45089 / JCM 17490 / NBRC 109087 / DQS3-9A1) TaxID=443218 RepID=F6EHK3_HOYSD|nr:plastocyanin/azurin family copper-binding protein [Hoyosella subflava]AEF42367.1 Amicyanin [Hoyosella subflava DQS3-9A1]
MVQATNMDFTPKTVVIQAGDTVEWVFDDGPVAHNVIGTGDNAPPDFASPMIALDTWSYTFDDAGEYEYVCSEHPQKTGLIVVE